MTQSKLNQFLGAALLSQLSEVASLQQRNHNRLLVPATESLRNIAHAIAYLNQAEVTDFDGAQVEQLIQSLQLESLLQGTKST